MRHGFFETVFTPSVQAEQTRHGSRRAYANLTGDVRDEEDGEGFTEREASFIASRDSFYLATVTETGWPYVQHRGGPAGFVRILGPRALAWADFSGNRQYVSIGNAAAGDRAAMIFMDYPDQRRLKVVGHMSVGEIGDAPDLAAQLSLEGYRAKVEHAIWVDVVGFDWNCPQHITQRFTAAEVESATAPLRARIARLEQQLAESSSAPG